MSTTTRTRAVHRGTPAGSAAPTRALVSTAPAQIRAGVPEHSGRGCCVGTTSPGRLVDALAI
ncbi:hypothetical protein [Actinoplanes sp. NPDC023714]|uniref:hypothetical protein n=1 Tax=Actinoplanes sp. NPDC023714 TaxID=3154322 RepID=UPI0033F4BEC8